eukprot:GHVP01041263.1.p1 GENE.GHVP01041263.1~~GHVP01041263.1.p1  ORF type:complete len:170 (-),score=11.65 GHVP01041263.1:166-675(-)
MLALGAHALYSRKNSHEYKELSLKHDNLVNQVNLLAGELREVTKLIKMGEVKASRINNDLESLRFITEGVRNELSDVCKIISMLDESMKLTAQELAKEVTISLLASKASPEAKVENLNAFKPTNVFQRRIVPKPQATSTPIDQHLKPTIKTHSTKSTTSTTFTHVSPWA